MLSKVKCIILTYNTLHYYTLQLNTIIKLKYIHYNIILKYIHIQYTLYSVEEYITLQQCILQLQYITILLNTLK